MSVKLATPTFVAGAKDDLATADIYSQTNDAVINSIQEQGDDLFDASNSLGLRGGKAMQAVANDKLTSSVPSLSLGEITSRIGNAVSAVASGIRNLSDSAAGALLRQIGPAMPNVPLVATLAGVSRQISPNAYPVGDVAAVGQIINKLAGTSTFALSDRGATVGTLSGVIGTATQMGIPNAFGETVKYFNTAPGGGVDRAALMQVAAKVMPSVIRSGDLSSLRSMATTLPPRTLPMINPTVISDFNSSYEAPASICAASDYEDKYDEVMETYTEIDPDWESCSREDEEIPSLLEMQNASEDMSQIVRVGSKLSDDPDAKLRLLSTEFPRGDVTTCLRRDFPATALAPESRTAPPQLDPRYGDDVIPDPSTHFHGFIVPGNVPGRMYGG